MSSVLAIIVSYHPSETIVGNVNALLEEVSQVVIVDNASSAESQKILSGFAKEKVVSIFNVDNRGVGEGFNQGLRWGMERGYDYFLLMDQDSRPTKGMVGRLLEVSASYAKNNQLVLVGPHHEDFERKLKNNITENILPVSLLITSGSLLSKKTIEVVGYYDERLFIDHVDHDYCLRLTKKGGRCFKVNSATLLHKFGEAQVKRFLGKSFFLQDYSSFRRYHMMRNRIVLYKRYGMFRGSWFWLDLRSAFKDLIKLVLFESGKGSKLKALLKGLHDGLKWKD